MTTNATQYTIDKAYQYGAYLKRVAADLADSGMESTAEDMAMAAFLIRQLILDGHGDLRQTLALLETDPARILAEARMDAAVEAEVSSRG